VIERFEAAARASGLRWCTQLEEGRPRAVLRACCDETTLLAVAAEGWFDQGVLDLRVDVAGRLDLAGLRPVRVLR